MSDQSSWYNAPYPYNSEQGSVADTEDDTIDPTSPAFKELYSPPPGYVPYGDVPNDARYPLGAIQEPWEYSSHLNLVSEVPYSPPYGRSDSTELSPQYTSIGKADEVAHPRRHIQQPASSSQAASTQLLHASFQDRHPRFSTKYPSSEQVETLFPGTKLPNQTCGTCRYYKKRCPGPSSSDGKCQLCSERGTDCEFMSIERYHELEKRGDIKRSVDKARESRTKNLACNPCRRSQKPCSNRQLSDPSNIICDRCVETDSECTYTPRAPRGPKKAKVDSNGSSSVLAPHKGLRLPSDNDNRFIEEVENDSEGQ